MSDNNFDTENGACAEESIGEEFQAAGEQDSDSDVSLDDKELKKELDQEISRPALAAPAPDQSPVNLFICSIAEKSETALCEALRAQPELAKSANAGGFTPLFHAAKHGKFALAKTLLELGADPNAQSKAMKWHALCLAVENPSFLRAMLEAKADPNLQTDSGLTALTAACSRKNAESVRILLQAGALVHPASVPLWPTPLAALSSPEIFELVDKAGADWNCVSNTGKTALHAAAKSPQSSFALQALIGRGLDPNALDRNGNTPLHVAAENNNIEACKLLLEAGADMALENLDGKIPGDEKHSAEVRALLAVEKDQRKKSPLRPVKAPKQPKEPKAKTPKAPKEPKPKKPAAGGAGGQEQEKPDAKASKPAKANAKAKKSGEARAKPAAAGGKKPKL